MTKAELTERIIDALVDPETDCPEDYMDDKPIDIYEATNTLNQIRIDEKSMDLEPGEYLPIEVTPTDIMETYNCIIRARKFECRVERLAAYITDNDCTCEYSGYYLPEHPDSVDIVPIDFLHENNFPFDLVNDASAHPLFLITLGQRSPEFNPNHEYCWYDKQKNQLFSTNNPFRDKVLDAEAFARHILLDADAFGYMFDEIIDDEDAKYILGCTKEEYINE